MAFRARFQSRYIEEFGTIHYVTANPVRGEVEHATFRVGDHPSVGISRGDPLVDNRVGATNPYNSVKEGGYMQQDLESAAVRGHAINAIAAQRCLRHHSELVRVVKEIDGIFAKFQRLLREQDRDPESESVRTKLGLLKREVSERLPILLQPVGMSLDELEFWEPDISSAFYEMWLDAPLPIQGPTTWLRYLGRWRAFVLEALEPEAGRTEGQVVFSQRNAAEPAAPSTALESSPRLSGTKETERHWSPKELAELWGVDQSTVRRIFRDEPGVLRIPHLGRRGKRDYVSLRIPASVAARVHERRSRSLFKI